MAVAKYKLEIDRQLRQAGCTVKSGRIYRPDGVFWGSRSDVFMFGRDAENVKRVIAAIAQHGQSGDLACAEANNPAGGDG